MIKLHCQRLPATENADAAPDIVMLHGWGMSSRVWAPWLAQLRKRANLWLVDLPGYGDSEDVPVDRADMLVAAILAVAPPRAVYLGYSLGGMLATLIAYHYPQRVQALVTLGSNARFVADPAWPEAMSRNDFDQFYSALDRPAPLLKRFAGLQVRGGNDERYWLKWLRERQEPLSVQCLQSGLNLLRRLDLRVALADLQVPSLSCFGERDALVPLTASSYFPNNTAVVIEQASHAMFFNQPEVCAELLWHFLQQHDLLSDEATPGNRNKRDVARSFSRAAATYDAVAQLQRDVGAELIERLPQAALADDDVVLDLGCGTGYFYAALQQRFPRARLVGMDLAEGMVEHAASRHPDGEWLCGDAENMPLPDNSVSLIFSSLTIQWCENERALFAEAFRVLKPGGRMLFSTLGPDTLHELRDAWERVDNRVHVNGFSPWQHLRDSLTGAGFGAQAAPQEQVVVLEYDSLRELTRELKSLGAHNVNPGRPTGLTGKTRLKQFVQAYDDSRNAAGKLPATYQVWYGDIEKPGRVGSDG